MPKYDMRCPNCGQHEVYVKSVQEYVTTEEYPCSQCGTLLERVFLKEANVMAVVVGVSKGNYNSGDNNG